MEKREFRVQRRKEGWGVLSVEFGQPKNPPFLLDLKLMRYGKCDLGPFFLNFILETQVLVVVESSLAMYGIRLACWRDVKTLGKERMIVDGSQVSSLHHRTCPNEM